MGVLSAAEPGFESRGVCVGGRGEGGEPSSLCSALLSSSPPRPLSGPRSSAALAERPGSEAAATVSIPWLERRGGHGLGEGRAQGPTECPAMSIPSGTREIAFDPPPSILRRTHAHTHTITPLAWLSDTCTVVVISSPPPTTPDYVSIKCCIYSNQSFVPWRL